MNKRIYAIPYWSLGIANKCRNIKYAPHPLGDLGDGSKETMPYMRGMTFGGLAGISPHLVHR